MSLYMICETSLSLVILKYVLIGGILTVKVWVEFLEVWWNSCNQNFDGGLG